MNTSKNIMILCIVSVIAVTAVYTAKAEPIGTTFTYQGRLIVDENQPANGDYDFQFKLYDSAFDGNQIGEDFNESNQVNDGYFTIAELDFNDDSAFNGNKRWLDIGVRPGVMDDPNEYDKLGWRQEITPTPYAIYAKNAGPWELDGTNVYYNNGNVGIGTTSPQGNLNVHNKIEDYGGEIVLTNNSMTAPLLLDSYLGAIWFGSREGGGYKAAAVKGVAEFDFNADDWASALTFWTTPNDSATPAEIMRITSSGNVGIGTTSPQGLLHLKSGSPIIICDATSTEQASHLYLRNSVRTWQLESDSGPGSHDVFRIDEATNEITDAGITRFVIESGGNVGIGTTNPVCKLDVEGWVQATGYLTGDVIFQKDGRKLWRMFEDENGVYLESLKTGRIFSFVLRESENDKINIEQTMTELRSENESLKQRIEILEKTTQELVMAKEAQQ